MNFITNLYQYEQLINEPRRVTKDNASLIDHFYTTKPDLIISSGVRIISISDHYLIYGIRKFYTTKGALEVVEYRDFKHFNENNFVFELESLSSLNLDNLDPNNSWLTWKNKFLGIVNKHAPWAAYKSLKNHYNRLIKSTMRQHYQEKIDNNSGDSTLHKYIYIVHIHSTIHNNSGDIIDKLDETSMLLVQYWAMKFLPRKYRESQRN